jgi:hypothetical protein
VRVDLRADLHGHLRAARLSAPSELIHFAPSASERKIGG